MKKEDNSLIGILNIVLAALCWSSGGVFLKFVESNIAVISAFRYLVGLTAIMLLTKSLPVFRVKNTDNSINKKETFYLWLGGIFFAVCSFFYVCANRYTTAANAILLQYTNPIWIIIFGPKFLGEKNSRIDYITIAGIILGMFLFFASEIFQDSGMMNTDMIKGDFFAIFSGFCLAFYTMLMRKQKNGKSIESSMLSQVIGFTATVPFLFIYELPDAKSSVFLVLCGLINGALAIFFYPKGLMKVSALTASLVSMLEPLMNPVWVLIFTGEKPGFMCIIGGIIIIGFVSFRTVFLSKKARPSP